MLADAQLSCFVHQHYESFLCLPKIFHAVSHTLSESLGIFIALPFFACFSSSIVFTCPFQVEARAWQNPVGGQAITDLKWANQDILNPSLWPKEHLMDRCREIARI
jgi:hypothetical protein